MAQLEGIRIRNYRSLRDVTLGRMIDGQDQPVLPRMLAFIGPNGSGKSSLLDAFGFIADCLATNVEDACDKEHRGGIERIRTRGSQKPIEFEIYYRENDSSRPISYTLHIDMDKAGRPRVVYERLRQRRKGQRYGRPFSFLELENGVGEVWAGNTDSEKETHYKSRIKLRPGPDLGISVLGALADHPRISAFRSFLQSWYLSYFVPGQARSSMPMSGVQKHLNRSGDNLANYTQYMERQHPDLFQSVLDRIARQIPGIKKITAQKQKDGRLLIQFDEKGYDDVFYQQDMSDGTLKMFAYLLLMEDPDPHSLVGLEEPENGLYHQLLIPLAQAMKKKSREKGPQMFVTTHSPFFIDALTPEEVWVLQKDKKGHSTVVRAADIDGIPELFSQDLPLGSLWYSKHFGWGGPA